MSINWNYALKTNPGGKGGYKSSDGAIHFGKRGEKSVAYSVLFYQKGRKKIGSPQTLSFGFNDTKVYCTPEPLGETFNVTGHNAGAMQVCGKDLTTKLIQKLTGKNPTGNENLPQSVPIVLERQNSTHEVYEIKPYKNEEQERFGF
tara:strand:+ start:586 stop:1023 length:438 start_codon:yes stop_codon:yes gene_type:complete